MCEYIIEISCLKWAKDGWEILFAIIHHDFLSNYYLIVG